MRLVTPVNSNENLGIIHSESKVAHKYLDGLTGIEIGAAAYKPFGLDAKNVSTGDENDRAHYKAIQLYVCGSYVEVDIEAEADDIPIDDHSVDFVVASHVLEHLPNPIAALLEWDRVLKVGGYVFLIVPKREAPYGDAHRRITTLLDFRTAYEQSWTDLQAFNYIFDRPAKEFDRIRGHYWVFDLDSLLELLRWCKRNFELKWTLIEAHQTDDTDGMGHMLMVQKC